MNVRDKIGIRLKQMAKLGVDIVILWDTPTHGFVYEVRDEMLHDLMDSTPTRILQYLMDASLVESILQSTK